MSADEYTVAEALEDLDMLETGMLYGDERIMAIERLRGLISETDHLAHDIMRTGVHVEDEA